MPQWRLNNAWPACKILVITMVIYGDNSHTRTLSVMKSSWYISFDQARSRFRRRSRRPREQTPRRHELWWIWSGENLDKTWGRQSYTIPDQMEGLPDGGLLLGTSFQLEELKALPADFNNIHEIEWQRPLSQVQKVLSAVSILQWLRNLLRRAYTKCNYSTRDRNRVIATP